jgi:hypothetical protein
MTAATVLANLRARGLRVERLGPALRVAPRAALSDGDRVVIREHLAELKALVATEGRTPPAVTVPGQPLLEASSERPRSALVTPDTLESALATVAAAREIVLDVETDRLKVKARPDGFQGAWRWHPPVSPGANGSPKGAGLARETETDDTSRPRSTVSSVSPSPLPPGSPGGNGETPCEPGDAPGRADAAPDREPGREG